MREVVGESNIQSLLTTGRGEVQKRVKTLMQAALDEYKAGINVTEVQLQNSNPPSAVIDAFRDVQAAQADQERMQFEANAYANKVVPQARGKASQITQAAEAYREQTVAAAQGETKRFLSIYAEYKKAEDVTRRRMYLETMQDVYSHINKVLIEGKDGKNVLPYLPLSGLKPNPDAVKSGGGATTSTSSTTSQGSK
jgi:membrane protease subunit HflK